MLELNQKAP